jgi:hypothetical protein
MLKRSALRFVPCGAKAAYHFNQSQNRGIKMNITHLSPAITDNVWAACELGATIFQCGQIRQLTKDRQIRGVHWYMTAFYIGWGLLNVPFYASLGQFHAMAAGICMTIANVAWLALALRYKRLPPVTMPVDMIRAARLLRAAAEDGLLAIKALANNPNPGTGALMVAAQARTNLENAIGTAQIRGISRAETLEGESREEMEQRWNIRKNKALAS